MMKHKSAKATDSFFKLTDTSEKYYSFEGAFNIMCSLEHTVVNLNGKTYLVHDGMVRSQRCDDETVYHIYLQFSNAEINNDGVLVKETQQYKFGTFPKEQKSYKKQADQYTAMFKRNVYDYGYWSQLLGIPVAKCVGQKIVLGFSGIVNKNYHIRDSDKDFSVTISNLYLVDMAIGTLPFVTIIYSDTNQTTKMSLSEAMIKLDIDASDLLSTKRQFAKLTFLYAVSKKFLDSKKTEEVIQNISPE